jgi:hypothetical protein
MTIFFLTFIPITVVADSAPNFDYTVEKTGVSADLLPYMALFAGKWKGGPDFKMVMTSFKGKKATITYGWGKWNGNESGFKDREVKYNPKKKKFSYSAGGRSFYYEFSEEKGMPVIKGTMVGSRPGCFRFHLVLLSNFSIIT